MAKRLLSLMLSALMIFSVTATVSAAIPIMGVADLTEEPAIGITIQQKSVLITGAAGETLQIVSLTGKQVLTAKIESQSQRIDINLAKGCYLIKVGKVVRKFSVQ